ncbi:MAG: YicC family protein [Muribaculaceae bacterium]|nr:YicC family protein [Muribaculaceae bacterium]
MISSMTGFGRGGAQTPNRRVKVEIKSLNSKQLDLSMRVPPCFREMEVTMRNALAERLERGKVELTATVENIVSETTTTVNVELLAQYKEQLENLGKSLNLPQPADWYSLLMRMPESMKVETTAVDELEKEAFITACMEAVDALVEFRRKEGKKLYAFFVEKIKRIRQLLSEIAPYEAERVPKIRERLEEQLSRLTSIEYDKGRLEQELIFYIEKLDVTEEKVRLSAHLNYFMETLGGEDDYNHSGQGKKLGFIAQEMGREINTLGSKSNHAEMQQIVVRMKDELEQVKEQVLNVL